MKIVVTGGAGFLGQKLAKALLQADSPLGCNELILADVVKPVAPAEFANDPRLQCLAVDLGEPDAPSRLIDSQCDVLFHLAAIVSGHAEADFDLGLKVNFDATRNILERARRVASHLKLVFTSTCGVFGGDLPPVIDDMTAVQPQNSYGMAKAMSELLINDYSRRGYVDGRAVRLPTVSVRAGAANKAVTSFASGIVREPLNGEVAECPVAPELELWLTSPETVVRNIIHAATLPSSSLGPWRVINLPGITASVQEMIDALEKVAGKKVASLVKFTNEKLINDMVSTFPTRFCNQKALSLGFTVDKTYEDIIKSYIRNDLKK